MKVIRNFFLSITKNIKLILYALVISVVIWFTVSLQIFPDVTKHIYDIPVVVTPTVSMQEENLQLAEPFTATVSVQVQGKRYDIGNLTADDFEATLDLSPVATNMEYELNIDVAPKDASLCTILSAQRTAAVKIIKIETKTFEVEPIASAVAVVDGMQINEAKLQADPATITLTGEKNLLDSIKRVEVHAVYDDVLSVTKEVEGRYVLYNNNNVEIDNPDIQADNMRFRVTVPIHKVKSVSLTANITGAPSNFDVAGLRSKIQILPQSITISSPDNSIDYIKEVVMYTVELSDLTYDTLLKTPIFQTISPMLPEGYENLSQQASANITFIDIEDYSSFPMSIPAEKIEFINVPANFDYELITQELSVNIVGPAGFVQALSTDDIQITVNLLGVQIQEGIRSFNVSYRIKGALVPAWITGVPQVEILFTEIGGDE